MSSIDNFPTNNIIIFKELQKLSKESKKKMGLVIGRSDVEPLPSEEGWIWASFDIEKRKKKLADRYHIAGENINILPWNVRLGLIGFDKVIVDWSTLKFFRKPWDLLHSFLKKNDESQLITELITGISYPTFGSWKHEPNGFDIQENIIETKPNWTKFEREEHIKKFEHATIKYLSALFYKVDYIKNEVYPTREYMNHHQKVDKFLIMTKPIKVINAYQMFK